MDLYCAIDIIDGGAVRLTQGDFTRVTRHGDPVSLALRYVDAGARILHVVDLDAARYGSPVNRDVVLRIVRATDVPVQVGGGARSVTDVAGLLEEGVWRVVLGTTAVEDPELVESLAERYRDRIAVGLDHVPRRRGGSDGNKLAVRGWETESNVSVESFVDRLEDVPVGALVVTAIDRDGTMSGPDVAGLVAVAERTSHDVVASGGVRSAGDLAGLSALSVRRNGRSVAAIAGAIVGRALAEGTLEVREALAACGL